MPLLVLGDRSSESLLLSKVSCRKAQYTVRTTLLPPLPSVGLHSWARMKIGNLYSLVWDHVDKSLEGV